MSAELLPYSWPTDKDLLKVIEDIKLVEPLLEQGLLRQDELTELESVASTIYDLLSDHNSIQYRKYDKFRRSNTIWRPVNRSGYVGMIEAGNLLILKQEITELLNLHNVDVQPVEVFLPPNSDFKARVTLKNILSQASSTIDIKDDYLFSVDKNTKNVDILTILWPYLEAPLDIKLRLLGGKDNPANYVVSDIITFIKQFPEVEIKGYSHSSTGKRVTHDRFIIIDKKDVYQIGSSIKGLGMSQSSINKVEDPKIVNEFKRYFQEWWDKAIKYKNVQ